MGSLREVQVILDLCGYTQQFKDSDAVAALVITRGLPREPGPLTFSFH